MTEMGDAFREMRQYQRERKSDRRAKFEAAFGFICKEAKEIGWDLKRFADEWRFCRVDDSVSWYPASGKTDTGDYFGTWPELKAHLVALGDDDE